MATTKRKFMAVTMKPELLKRVHAIAAKRDMRVTAWVREVVESELTRIKENETAT